MRITVLPAVFLLIPFQSFAQISLSVENMGLGGGGTAYLTGYETLFVNPANLYIQEKNYSLQVSLLQGAGYYDSQLAVNSPTARFKRFSETFYPYSSQLSNRIINTEKRTGIINRNYSDGRLTATQQSKADIYWLGLKWSRENRSYALALRTRISSRSELGRGFFSDEPSEINEGYRVDRSFSQQYQSLHEISFGYAESFTLLNGLVPQLSEFIIGIAPKIVLSGSYLSTNYTNRYNIAGSGSGWTHEQKFSQQSTGYFTETNDSFYHTGILPVPNAGQYSTNDLLRPSGIGMGLDVGITYLITFGDDFSTLRRQDVPTEKSLRFSFSITDLGAVYQYEQPISFESDYSNVNEDSPGPVSGLQFAGAPDEHLFFLDQNEEHPLRSAETRNSDTFDTMLPVSMQTGILFQINRLKVMGDFSYALRNSAFSSSGLASYFGVELRPLSFLPLRTGTRLSADLPGYYSFGAGIETRLFELNAAVQLKNKRIGPTTEIAGASIVGVKFYIP